MKCHRMGISLKCTGRSREGAWIEMPRYQKSGVSNSGRSREGAWIEIYKKAPISSGLFVAPARERGLKWKLMPSGCPEKSVAPARERGLKYELHRYSPNCLAVVAPARERGLKCWRLTDLTQVRTSLPRGSVD